jgi:heme-degrading monooxygenase HmoA
MPVIVVTRLRLRDPALFDEFFASAVAVTEQATSSDGNLGADVLADANNVFWTLTAWQARSPMQAFVGSEPHLTTMARLDDWCDEATFADWEQSSPDLPDWQTSYGRLIADGQVASLTHASDAHQARAFPAPVTAP